jgi:hypothetical protein
LPAPGLSLFARGSQERRRAAADDLARAYRLLAEGRWLPAWRQFDRLPPRADSDAGRDVDLAAAFAAYKSIELARARELLRPLYDDVRASARRPAVSYYLGRVSHGLGAFRDGARALERFAAEHPRLADEVVANRLPAR